MFLINAERSPDVSLSLSLEVAKKPHCPFMHDAIKEPLPEVSKREHLKKYFLKQNVLI